MITSIILIIANILILIRPYQNGMQNPADVLTYQFVEPSRLMLFMLVMFIVCVVIFIVDIVKFKRRTPRQRTKAGLYWILRLVLFISLWSGASMIDDSCFKGLVDYYRQGGYDFGAVKAWAETVEFPQDQDMLFYDSYNDSEPIPESLTAFDPEYAQLEVDNNGSRALRLCWDVNIMDVCYALFILPNGEIPPEMQEIMESGMTEKIEPNVYLIYYSLLYNY